MFNPSTDFFSLLYTELSSFREVFSSSDFLSFSPVTVKSVLPWTFFWQQQMKFSRSPLIWLVLFVICWAIDLLIPLIGYVSSRPDSSIWASQQFVRSSELIGLCYLFLLIYQIVFICGGPSVLQIRSFVHINCAVHLMQDTSRDTANSKVTRRLRFDSW